MHRLYWGLVLACAPLGAAAQNAARAVTPPSKQVVATRVAAGAVRLDGRLDDSVWMQARWIADFVQKMPHEGAAPSDSMRIGILYDDAAVYVGARMYSRAPGRIQAPLSRRDNTAQAEHLWVSFDTYHDHRTAYSFGITASGVRMDWYHAGDNEYNIDVTFDPVWEGKAVIDSLGWTAEMRIPFSQLRFNRRAVQVWGFNADHWNPATSEDVFWIPVPTNQTGWSSWMGELVGIAGIAPSRRLEVVPYGAGSATVTGARDPANPYDDGKNLAARAGADFKMGLGPNLTVDGTVNPDFGQVEADPAVVNLSAFEVFFDEKRPFFTEGSQLLRGNGPNYFYSRRIGAAPRGDATGDFVDYPSHSAILGAAKLTGRLASGMSLGALAAVTGRETARTVVFDSLGAATFGRVRVAPLSGYGVARLQQEFGAASSVVGVTFTGVRRDVAPGSALAALYDRDALTGGVDWRLRWAHGSYELNGWLGFSHLAGDTAAVNAIQRSAVHFFQRPDARYVTYRPDRTSLNGSTAELGFSKNGGGHWRYGVGAGWESPGLDLNDAGRLTNADGRTASAGISYVQTHRGRRLQSFDVGAETDAEWDFGGDRQFMLAELSSTVTFHNFWAVHAVVDYLPRAFDHAATRGGPEMATPENWDAIVSLGNSFGARTAWSGRIFYGRDGLGGETYRVSGGLSVRPSARFQLSATPNYLRAISSRQYVTTFDSGGPAATYGGRYVFGVVDQSTFLVQLRLNYTLAPDLTLELYGEPFAASGRYYGLGELAAPRTYRLREYGTGGTTLARNADGSYTVSDNGGADTLAIANPDFNVLSFRSNAVLRWEWRPGSTLFLVWQQQRFAADQRGELVRPGDLWDSLRATGDHFFAVKVSYWLPAS